MVSVRDAAQIAVKEPEKESSKMDSKGKSENSYCRV